jgi:hypothetical protein
VICPLGRRQSEAIFESRSGFLKALELFEQSRLGYHLRNEIVQLLALDSFHHEISDMSSRRGKVDLFAGRLRVEGGERHSLSQWLYYRSAGIERFEKQTKRNLACVPRMDFQTTFLRLLQASSGSLRTGTKRNNGRNQLRLLLVAVCISSFFGQKLISGAAIFSGIPMLLTIVVLPPVSGGIAEGYTDVNRLPGRASASGPKDAPRASATRPGC